MPRCGGASGSVRASTAHQLAYCAPRRPRLLAVDHEVVAAVLRARAQRREIRAGIRLGEALAPDVVAAEDPLEVRGLLLGRSLGHDRRADDLEPDLADQRRRARPRELLVGDDLLHQRRAAAAVLGRPGEIDEPRLVQLALPAAEEVDTRVEVGRDLVRRRQVLGEERAHLVADAQLGVVQREPHQRDTTVQALTPGAP